MLVSKRSQVFPIAALAALIFLAGCSIKVDEGKDEKGDKKSAKVDISTPLGSLKVREDVDPQDTGLPVMEGARRLRDKGDEHSAMVSIDTDFFGLKVVAASFESDQSPAKVLDFYRGELGKFGKVVECHGGFKDDDNIKSASLECDQGKSHSDEIQLGVGSEGL